MGNQRTNFIILIFLIMGISCKKKELIRKQYPLKKYEEKQTVYNRKGFTVKFNLPDTLYKDSIYQGIINYEHLIDTINKQLKGEDYRTLLYLYKKTDTLVPILKKNMELVIKRDKYDTLYGILDRKLFFLNKISFSKTGKNYIDGFVKDDVFIKIDKEKVTDKERLRWINNTNRVIHKVFVIDK